MKLYYYPGACSLADHVALAEANLPYELVKVNLARKTLPDGADYLAVNPKGYVPALRLDDGEVVTENLAVLAVIAERAPFLLPAGPLGRVRALEAAAYVSTELHKGFKPFFNGKASEAERDEARGTLEKRFAYLGERLAPGGFLFGDAISVADCYLFVMLTWAEKFGVDPGAGLQALLGRMRERPAVRQALAEEGLG